MIYSEIACRAKRHNGTERESKGVGRDMWISQFGKLCVPLKTSWLRPCALQPKEPPPGVTWIFFSVVSVCNMSEITHSSPFKDAGLQAEVYTSTLIVCWPLLQPVIIWSQAINAKNLNYTELKPSRSRLLRFLSPLNSKINGLSLNLNIVRLNRSFSFWNRLNTISISFILLGNMPFNHAPTDQPESSSWNLGIQWAL